MARAAGIKNISVHDRYIILSGKIILKFICKSPVDFDNEEFFHDFCNLSADPSVSTADLQYNILCGQPYGADDFSDSIPMFKKNLPEALYFLQFWCILIYHGVVL